jgi:RNA polymerase sigma-B factor
MIEQTIVQNVSPDLDVHRSERDAVSLFKQYEATRDKRLRNRLVSMHMNLVRYLASKFAGRGEPYDDLVQVGTIGLINAVDRFEPQRGMKFSTYATPTIAGEIRRHFRDKAWSVRAPRRLQELNLAVSKAQESLTNRLGRSPTICEVAEMLGITEEETLQAIEAGGAYDAVSLDSKFGGDEDSSSYYVADSLGEDDIDISNLTQHAALTEAIDKLAPKDRTVITCRFFHDMSQAEIASLLNISQMHVSRLQKRALKTLQTLLKTTE